jgi:tetratricopeptide (TPR) repeat protein
MKKHFEYDWKQIGSLFLNKDYEGVLHVLNGTQNQNLERFLFEGMCLSRLDRQEAALSILTQGLDVHPDNPELLAERAVAFLHLGKKSLCILDLDKAVEVDQNNPYRYASRGFVREKIGDIEGATSDYEKALELDPSDAITHNNLGMIFEKKGRAQQAKSHFDLADALQGLEGTEIWNNAISNANELKPEDGLLGPSPWYKEMWKPILIKEERRAFWRWLKGENSK